ncbi:MAG TPA: TIM barrel protein [Oligoflexia bacterium]|nr:TIM barrel protein [Oligoflexia bacterium]HMP27382.1 TIM barrel protein [Oligoflexia bacterium]
MKNKLKITTINDEISDDLNNVIEFLKKCHIKYVELRTIKKRNIIHYSLSEVEKVRESLLKNGISVSAFASPLFKWYPHNSNNNGESNEKIDTFGFDTQLDETAKRKYISKAIAVAKALGTQNIRLFSSLRSSSAKYSFASDPLFHFALNEARKSNIRFLLENEPLCYIHKMSDIKKIARKFSNQNFGIWFDIANFYKIKEQVFKKDLEELKDLIGYFHLKNFDEAKNYTPLGEGIINYKHIISNIRNIFKDVGVFLSIETHVHSDPKGATEKSLQILNKLLY